MKPSPARSTNPVYFLPKSVGIWLACGFLSMALLHLLCCSPRGAQEAVFTQVLQYADDTYSKFRSRGGGQRCDYSEGRWVWAPGHARRYNATVCDVKEAQDCLRNGRPDTGYLDWRWQPAGCRLPAFDPAAFLSAVRGKHVAFVGDSMSRNQAESLVCLLTAASPYRVVHRDPVRYKRQFMRWAFPTHDATVSVYWAPYLARATGKSENYSMPYNLVHLDALGDRWASDADTMDVVVLAANHWMLNPAVYHNGSEVLGAHGHPELNHTEIGYAAPLRQAYRMSLERLSSGRSRTVVLATFSPTHFENNRMDDPTACDKKEPYKEGEKELNSMEKELRRIVVEEAEAVARRNGPSGAVRFEVLDVTKLAAMRPDGHPGPYMNRDPFANGVPQKMPTDCLHFCLPGPVDTFNEILQQILTKRQ
ncbi:Protein ALTERED XYLOGLUCAN 4 [Dichanthelium oligosanthes]|uniref:Protein ALTERED XYLOGLUCAN 4 n=1 Tax=Dichanthelium oligosanthes TaxID=888268 RepID=A0A1E5VWJ7_9POAL|nr:Protein ALTERED XYLOGLUCAN 4 [Dichanthelium oligosanthes]